MSEPITGYRILDETDVATINFIKELGVGIERFVEALRQDPDFDPRWIAIGATDMQRGLMALTRSVARPTTFA